MQISRIVASPNSKSAWNELLLYAPAILSKPKRGGAKRNINNIINRRTANWDKDRPRDSIPPANNKRSCKDKNEDQYLVAAVRSKLEAGNLKATFRILCSEDTPAPPNEATLQALKEKHLGPASDRRPPIDPSGDTRYTPLEINSADIKRALRTFPSGCSGGPDGLTPQHLVDQLAGDDDGELLNALTDLTNLMLAGKFDTDINSIIYGGRLIALSKKGVGVRPIAVGYTVRRLTAKCANTHVIEERSKNSSSETSWSWSSSR